MVPRRLVLLHTMDPRGDKLGGIETHVRLVMARHAGPLLFVGIDETGDLAPGRVTTVAIDGRAVEFLPVAHVLGDRINEAATSIGESTTLRFALGALRHLLAIRRAVGRSACCEIERFEFAILPKLLGLPFVLMVHNEGTKADKMDSLLKRYWFVHEFNERVALALADRIFAVNESIGKRIAGLGASLGAKTEVMSVSVDTDRFAATPFPAGNAFHVCFAGRLDDFKDPPLMVATLAALARSLAETPAGRFSKLAFDYVGASDPTRIPGFAAIEPITMRHGICRAPQVAAIMAGSHAGIITSFFEGMPCYLLEMLASGRPVGAIRLPQFEPLVREGVSGALVDRAETPTQSAAQLAAAFRGLAEAITADRLDVQAIAALAQPYSVESQMSRLFAAHDGLRSG